MSKDTGHKFNAQLRYTFSKYALEPCANCGKKQDEHTDSKCLFDSTVFQPQSLMTFFKELIRNGGTMTIQTGNQTLHQKIKVYSVDQLANTVSGAIATEGDAFLEESNGAKKR